MLEKIIQLSQVGRFETWNSVADVKFRRFTVLYATNGAGKTTLVAMLRAAREGCDRRVLARKRLAATPPPKVKLKFEDGVFTFDGRAWTGLPSTPLIELFDSEFIERNVFVGREVGTSQRAAILELALGETEVTAAQEIDVLASKIEVVQKDRREQEARLETIAREYRIGRDDFSALPIVAQSVEAIAELERRIAAVRGSQSILARPSLEPLSGAAPFAIDELDRFLRSSAATAGDAAEALVRKHLVERLGDSKAEAWVQEGLEYQRDSAECPFCGQDSSASELLRAFRAHFDATYRTLIETLTKSRDRLDEFMDAARRWRPTEQSNRVAAAAWQSDLGDAPDATAVNKAFEELERSLGEIRRVLGAKIGSPLDSIDAEREIADLHASDANCRTALSIHNDAIAAYNRQIADFKSKLGGASISALEDEKNRVRAAVRRHQDDCTKLVANIARLTDAKKALEAEKKEAREAFDEAQRQHLASFESEVNRVLRRLGAEYTVQSFKTAMQGGTPSASYQLGFDGGAFAIGGRNPPGPTFGDVLSEGDKVSLALAVFFAHLERCSDLDRRIVVFDDPMSSLDADRRNATRELIRDTAEQARQTIVLSHDAYFLRSLVQKFSGDPPKELTLSKSDRSLSEWNARDHCEDAYFKRLERVQRFARSKGSDGDSEGRRQDLRLLLEEHYRFRFPSAWGPTDWLGQFIAKVRSAAPLSALGSLDLAELGAINDFSSASHHAGGPDSDPPPSASEVRTYAGRTVRLVTGEWP